MALPLKGRWTRGARARGRVSVTHLSIGSAVVLRVHAMGVGTIVSATARVAVWVLVVGHGHPLLLPQGTGRAAWHGRLPHPMDRYLLASLNSRMKPENMPLVLPSCSPTAFATFAPLSADAEEDATLLSPGEVCAGSAPAASS